MKSELLMTSDAARELAVSRQTVIRWERIGLLRAMRTANGFRLFRRSEIDRIKVEREQGQDRVAFAEGGGQ